MKKELINLIIGIVIVILTIIAIAYFVAQAQNKRIENESEIRMVIKEYQHRIDSLNSVIMTLEQSFYQDSVDHALEETNSQKAIKSLQKRLYETSFKHYNNSQLDSVITALFPGAKLYSPTGNGTVSN